MYALVHLFRREVHVRPRLPGPHHPQDVGKGGHNGVSTNDGVTANLMFFDGYFLGNPLTCTYYNIYTYIYIYIYTYIYIYIYISRG